MLLHWINNGKLIINHTYLHSDDICWILVINGVSISRLAVFRFSPCQDCHVNNSSMVALYPCIEYLFMGLAQSQITFWCDRQIGLKTMMNINLHFNKESFRSRYILKVYSVVSEVAYMYIHITFLGLPVCKS